MKALIGSFMTVALVGVVGCGDKRAFRPVEVNTCDLSVQQTLDVMTADKAIGALSLQDIADNSSEILGMNLFWKMKPATKSGELATPESLVVDLLLKGDDSIALVNFKADATQMKSGQALNLKAIQGEDVKTQKELADSEIASINERLSLVAMDIEGCESTSLLAKVKDKGVSTYTFTQELKGSIVNYKMSSSSDKSAMSITQAMVQVSKAIDSSNSQQGQADETLITPAVEEADPNAILSETQLLELQAGKKGDDEESGTDDEGDE